MAGTMSWWWGVAVVTIPVVAMAAVMVAALVAVAVAMLAGAVGARGNGGDPRDRRRHPQGGGRGDG